MFDDGYPIFGQSVFFYNKKCKKNPAEYLKSLNIGIENIKGAEKRMIRFAPLIAKLFPKTGNGVIESPFKQVKELQKILFPEMKGSLYMKLDSHLEVAGSIKARGGIYEVLKVTEDLLIKNNLLCKDDDYAKISESKIKEFLAGYSMSVASTGNLGLSIGIMSTALGYNSRVHMSRDAKKWKKDRLIENGVTVIEHAGDFTYAVMMARQEAEEDDTIHFVDDERSTNLFMGYSVAALRIKKDLAANNIVPTDSKPLHLYLPCGVGGAPGGITFGFKHVFGSSVKCYFSEPVTSPSMMLSVMTGKYGMLNVKDYGLDNMTELDGLAVASPSDFVSPMMTHLCNGFYTVKDDEMFRLLYLLKETENIKIEPSAAAGIPGPEITENTDSDGYPIIWTTRGLFIPDKIYDKMYARGKVLYENSRN
ncbi:MAG: D-serine ammonia-lyase [Clostridiales bacterium]|nr:D-serine ammonia-lyase [Clostridiales bacterium]